MKSLQSKLTPLLTPLVYTLVCTLMMSGFTLSCVEVPLPDDSEFKVEGQDEVIADVESKSLAFTARAGTYSLNIQSKHLTLVCDYPEAEISFDGYRVVCLPDSISSPLYFHDIRSGRLASIDVWERTSLAKPTLASDGTTLIVPTPLSVEDPNNVLSVLRVFDDLGFAINEITSLILHGFLGPDHALINDPLEIWSFRTPEQEPIAVGARRVEIHNFPPYGVLFEDGNRVYFFGVNDDVAREVAQGDLINANRGQVLIEQEIEQEGRRDKLQLALYNLNDSTLISRQDAPTTPFYRDFEAELLGDGVVLIQEKESRTCGDDRVSFALKSTYFNFKTKKQYLLMDEDTPHFVDMGIQGKYAFIMKLDPCARPTQEAWLKEISQGKVVQLPETIKGKVKGGRVSRFGGYIGLYSEEVFWLLDTQTFQFDTVLSGDPIDSIIGFR